MDVRMRLMMSTMRDGCWFVGGREQLVLATGGERAKIVGGVKVWLDGCREDDAQQQRNSRSIKVGRSL